MSFKQVKFKSKHELSLLNIWYLTSIVMVLRQSSLAVATLTLQHAESWLEKTTGGSFKNSKHAAMKSNRTKWRVRGGLMLRRRSRKLHLVIFSYVMQLFWAIGQSNPHGGPVMVPWSPAVYWGEGELKKAIDQEGAEQLKIHGRIDSSQQITPSASTYQDARLVWQWWMGIG